MAYRKKKDKKCHYFAQANSLKLGLKKFWTKDKDRARKEVKQLNDRTAWKPVHPNDLTIDEKKKVMESLIFLSEKRYSTVEGRVCANGSTQRSRIPREKIFEPDSDYWVRADD